VDRASGFAGKPALKQAQAAQLARRGRACDHLYPHDARWRGAGRPAPSTRALEPTLPDARASAARAK
jgi:hypothetical protein